ncbi:MAG: FMN-binding protein [Cetobacterium sp.]|uniref:FMN-binding protein n=1 Tax=Cetobacterium sp. TaxID=2071632 RepID=UPI003F2D139A
MKNFLILSLLISSISLANESIGIGKNEKYGYEIKLKVEKEANGNIKNIEVLENNTKKSISEKAIPKLIEQAKMKNSGDIDIVSGATYTSDVFIKALNNALNTEMKN